MGGKKKTKWRKLPLDEFTKDSKQQTKDTEETKSDHSRIDESDHHLPAQIDTENNPLQYGAEYHENPNDLVYLTQYLTYNLVETPMYPNYIVPPDSNCYYYPPNEVNPTPGYPPFPYQDFIPPAKDTIYLVFPASALRVPQVSPYDWRNRRRKRRYGGYAEYAVIPDKGSVDEANKDRSNGVTADKFNYSSSRCGKSSDFKGQYRNKNEILQNSNQEPDIVKIQTKGSEKNCESETKMGLSNCEKNDDSANRPKKNIDACGIHGKNSVKQVSNSGSINNAETMTTNNKVNGNSETTDLNIDKSIIENENKVPSNLNENIESAIVDIVDHKRTEIMASNYLVSEAEHSEIMRENLNLHSATVTENSISSNASGTESDDVENVEVGLFPSAENNSFCNLKSGNRVSDTNILNPGSLPDIVNTSNNSTLPRNFQIICDSNVSSNTQQIRNITPVHKLNQTNVSIKNSPVQSTINPFVYNSDNLSLDGDNTSTQASKPNPLYNKYSIYKLAFDESLSLTDRSDSGSRSPSPIDPASQVPSSIVNHEINVYEADSGDEAGSEDLELIPHRYESESFLNRNKHVYENKLSLAVELLRTKESLPYDSQFKRLTDENNQDILTTGKGEVNLGFRDDSNFIDSFEMKDKCSEPKLNSTVITNQRQTNVHATPFEIPLENSLTDSCEIADEICTQSDDAQENTEEAKSGQRRYGLHYFSTRSTLLSPWNCCIVM